MYYILNILNNNKYLRSNVPYYNSIFLEDTKLTFFRHQVIHLVAAQPRPTAMWLIGGPDSLKHIIGPHGGTISVGWLVGMVTGNWTHCALWPIDRSIVCSGSRYARPDTGASHFIDYTQQQQQQQLQSVRLAAPLPPLCLCWFAGEQK